MPVLRRAAVLLLALSLPAWGAGTRVADDTGREVTLAAPAARIVSLSPHATELLYAAGAGGRIVGAVAYSDFPPEAARLPHVGDAHALDLERILALRPDLAVAWASGNSAGQVERLRQAGIPVFMSEPRRAEDVASSIERLGALAGTPEAARQAAGRFRAELAAFEAAYRGAQPFRLFYEIWHTPLMTLNGRHYVSDMLGRCGARNVFADEATLVPTVSLEAVIAAAPEAVASGAGEVALDDWRARRELPAARSGRVCATDPARLHRAGPRLVAAAREACACLHATDRR